MSKQKVKTLKINESVGETLLRITEELNSNEKIIETSVAGDYLVVIIESTESKRLLLD